MPNDDNKRIAKNTLYLYIRLVFVLLISLYTSRVVLHALGVVDYGVYNVVAGFVSMLSLLSTSLTNAVQRFYNYEIGQNGREASQKVYISSLYIQIIIAVVILVLAETIGIWYIENKMVYPLERSDAVYVVYQAAVVALLLTVMQIPYTAAIIANERINYYAIIGVLDVVLKLVISLLIAYSSSDRLVIYGILMAAVSVADFIFYFIYAKHQFRELKYKRVFYKDVFTKMLSFSGWHALNGFSQTIKNQGVNMIMNFFLGPAVNAARGISYQIKSALLGFVMNITTAAQPQMIESYSKGDIGRSERLFFSVSKIIFLSLLIVVLPIIINVKTVLTLWLGPDYPKYTEIFTILVLLITLVDILMTPITIMINAKGDVGLYNFSVSLMELLTLPLAYVILKMDNEPHWVFVMSLFLSILTVMISLIIMQKKTSIRIISYVKEVIYPLIKVVLASAVLMYCLSINNDNSFFVFILSIFILVISVIMASYFLALKPSEREMIKEYMCKITNKLCKSIK